MVYQGCIKTLKRGKGTKHNYSIVLIKKLKNQFKAPPSNFQSFDTPGPSFYFFCSEFQKAMCAASQSLSGDVATTH